MKLLPLILALSWLIVSYGNLFAIEDEVEFCKQSYFYEIGLLSYTKRPRKVPLILGMPNSGVVWMRDIIEQHTRIPTGSLGLKNGSIDRSLLSIFPRGDYCSSRASALACERLDMIHVVNRGNIAFRYKAQEKYCRSDGVYSFHTVILLIRNPFDAILRGYQRQHPNDDRFVGADWRSYAINAAASYESSWNLLQRVIAEMGSKLILLRYEHLVDPARFSGLLDALVVFFDRAPRTQDALLRKQRVISCLDRYPTRKHFDELNTSAITREPYRDASLVQSMIGSLSTYLSVFGYPAQPPTYTSLNSIQQQLLTSNSAYCRTLQDSVRLADERLETGSIPPLILALPGSGVIWLRKLIELVTGWNTGSLGLANGEDDTHLKTLFGGEQFCGRRFSAIHSIDAEFVSWSKGSLRLDSRAQRARCRKGVVFDFNRVILLVRNPYHALISAYRAQLRSHSGLVVIDDSWISFVKKELDGYRQAWDKVLSKLTELPQKNLLVIKFEDLTQADRKQLVLRQLAEFIGSFSSATEEGGLAVQSLREACVSSLSAFEESENIGDLEYSSPPFASSLVTSYAMNILKSYATTFGYELPPPLEMVASNNSILATNSAHYSPDSAFSCIAYYSAVSFAPSLAVMREIPPILLSLPGSGVIWTRKLIELVTGWYTGSLGLSNGGVDPELKRLFPGEEYCGRRFSVITNLDMRHVSVSEKGVELGVKAHRQKCRRGVIHSFSKAVVLVRNPYHALIAAYRGSLDSSSKDLPLPMRDDWEELALELADSYNSSWFRIFDELKKSHGNKIFVLRYEHLQEPDLRKSILHNLTLFIGSRQNSSTDIEMEIQAHRESCTSMLSSFDDTFDVAESKYVLPPYDDAMLSVIQPFIRRYAIAFGYDVSPPANLVGVRKAAVSSNKSAAVLSLWNYSRLLSDYDPPLMLGNEVKPIVAVNRCAQHFSYRRFWVVPRQVPVLLSYAGSGNTWVRQLIEFSTAIFSGSTDPSDGVLQEEFIGEKYCGKEMSVIKAHPDHLELTDAGQTKLVLPLQYDKCSRGGIKTFDKYVLLVRDPYRAILAEYNREVTQSHIGRVTVNQFLASSWHSILMEEAEYVDRHWHSLVLPLIQNHQKVYIARFEDLIDAKKREGALQKMVNFIDPSTKVTLERIRCAFLLADTTHAHRTYFDSSVNASYVYRNQTFVDELWGPLRKFAEYMGYSKYS